MPKVSVHPDPSKGVKIVSRYRSPRGAHLGVIWCPHCDTSYQDSPDFSACPNLTCRAVPRDLTEEEYDRLVNPPLEDRMALQTAKARSAEGALREANYALGELERESFGAGESVTASVGPVLSAVPDAPGVSSTTAATATAIPSLSEPERAGDGHMLPKGWRLPLETEEVEGTRIIHIACQKDFSPNAGAYRAHERACPALKAAAEKPRSNE